MYRLWKEQTEMSNPSRQINSRRLPPIGGGLPKRGNSPQGFQGTVLSPTTLLNPKSPLKGGYFKTPSYSDMVITGYNVSSTIVPNRPSLSSVSSDRHISSYDLNPDVVTTYLHDNPEFLDKYVLSQVNQDVVEKWLLKKTNQTKNRHKNSDTNSPVNGDLSPRHTPRRDSLSKWKFSVHGDKRKLLQEMTKDIHQHQTKAQVLSELTACIAAAVNADGFNLYLIDDHSQEIYHYKPNSNSAKTSSSCVRKVAAGTHLAAYVAHSKETVRQGQPLKDERFPEGVPLGGDSIVSILSQPVIKASGDAVGVIELYKTKGNKGFTEEDEEVSFNMLLLTDLVLQCNEVYHNMLKQRKLNEFLLTVTKSIFQDIVSMDTVIMKIMNYAKKLVNADRTSLFLVDNRTKELYARVFDMGEDLESGDESSIKNHKEIRFPIDKGVAGHVASTGEILNIPDAYADDRFNRDVDLQTGYSTKTILCMPIYIRGNIIGVVQMVNKIDGVFNKLDEDAFETFAVYCGLALHHAKLYEKIRRSEQKYKVALEVLSYHSQATDEEVEKLQSLNVNMRIPELCHYDFSPWSIDGEEQPLYVIHMFKELFHNTSTSNRDPDADLEQRFDMRNLFKFTLTVRKNYRQVPYHNWAHAFSVAHAMFTVIKTTKNTFTPLENLSLFVAALCHDLDHRGKTNSFMVKSSSPLAAVYGTSTMEHHHFNQTVSILQNDGHNIFKHLSSEEYKQVLGDIRHCILATDLALFFGNRAKLKELIDGSQFSWESKEHRMLLMANSMTASDLCSMYKPWDLQVQLVNVIMEEFWLQGDEEKRQGNHPIPMMDREKADQLPQSQVGFLVGICLPCFDLLKQILPETIPMSEGATANLQQWQRLADKQKDKIKEIE